MAEFVCDRVENIVGKGQNAGSQHFLLFPQCFSKGLFFKVVKSWDCMVMTTFSQEKILDQSELKA